MPKCHSHHQHQLHPLQGDNQGALQMEKGASLPNLLLISRRRQRQRMLHLPSPKLAPQCHQRLMQGAALCWVCGGRTCWYSVSFASGA